MAEIFDNKNVLVTGGAGAIGSILAMNLINLGAKVLIIDDLSSGKEINIPQKAHFCKLDISQGFDKIDFEPDYIFHCAAFFANQNSVDYPERDLTVNGIGLLKLLEWAKNKKSLLAMVYLSSSCVYGNENSKLEGEKIDIKLDTPYAMTKLLGEGYCEFYFRYFKVPITIVRLFNSYGPNEFPGKYRNVIPNFFEKALEGLVLNITGSGEETRDFTFVEDTVQGIISACSPKYAGEVFNLGTGKETKIIDIANIINNLTKNAAGIQYVSKRDWDKVDRRRANISKAKNILKFEPKISIEKGLLRTFDWYQTWWGKV